MFDEFESSDEENYDHHFRRGKELKQKGNLIEAIQEFQIAAKDPQKKVRNSSILALCYMEKGDYPLAIDEFSKVLELITPADKGYCNVKYEMARAYMGNNDYNKALELYSDVNQMDPEFKDVAVKVDELKTLTTNAGAASKAKRDRVSYI
jgi:tetratricopeptide (TPR) repeat protein